MIAINIEEKHDKNTKQKTEKNTKTAYSIFFITIIPFYLFCLLLILGMLCFQDEGQLLRYDRCYFYQSLINQLHS